MAAKTELTKAKRWVLDAGRNATVSGGCPAYSVFTSFKTGETRYGHQRPVVDACKAAGWLSDEGRTTASGLAALAKAEA